MDTTPKVPAIFVVIITSSFYCHCQFQAGKRQRNAGVCVSITEPILTEFFFCRHRGLTLHNHGRQEDNCDTFDDPGVYNRISSIKRILHRCLSRLRIEYLTGVSLISRRERNELLARVNQLKQDITFFRSRSMQNCPHNRS